MSSSASTPTSIPHVHTHTGAVIDSATGGVLGEITVRDDRGGDSRGLGRAGGVRQHLSDDAGLWINWRSKGPAVTVPA
jgi:hypothetical protein